MKVQWGSVCLSGGVVYTVWHNGLPQDISLWQHLKQIAGLEKKRAEKEEICPSEELILSGPREYFILGHGSRRALRRVLLTGEQRHPCKTIF